MLSQKRYERRGSAHRDEGCSHVSGTSCSGFRSSFLPSELSPLKSVVLETKELDDSPPHHSGGVFTPLPLFSKRQGLGPGGIQGSVGWARRGWVSHPSAQETFLRPCLPPPKPHVLLPNPAQHLGTRGGSRVPGGPQPTPSTWLGRGQPCSPPPHPIPTLPAHAHRVPPMSPPGVTPSRDKGLGPLSALQPAWTDTCQA